MLSKPVRSYLLRTPLRILAGILISACGDGELPTETPPDLVRNHRAAELALHVILADTSGEGRLSFRGTLIAGSNPVRDGVLEILGESFAGQGPYSEGYWEYDGTLDGLPRETFRRLVDIVAPEVAGVSPAKPTVQAAPLSRVDESFIEVRRGGLPELAISGPVAPPPPGSRIEWSMTVLPEGEEARHVFGTGLPPGRIPVPELVLPGGIQKPTSFVLHYSVLPELRGVPDGAYRLRLSFTVLIGWTVMPESEL